MTIESTAVRSTPGIAVIACMVAVEAWCIFVSGLRRPFTTRAGK